MVYERFVTEGKVAIAFLDLPFTDDAVTAARAAHCAGDQGKFWEMHDQIFAYQNELGTPDFVEWAEEIEVDGAAFSECLDGKAHLAAIREDRRTARLLNIFTTPSFLIAERAGEGKVRVIETIRGAPQPEVLAAKIDALLAE